MANKKNLYVASGAFGFRATIRDKNGEDAVADIQPGAVFELSKTRLDLSDGNYLVGLKKATSLAPDAKDSAETEADKETLVNAGVTWDKITWAPDKTAEYTDHDVLSTLAGAVRKAQAKKKKAAADKDKNKDKDPK